MGDGANPACALSAFFVSFASVIELGPTKHVVNYRHVIHSLRQAALAHAIQGELDAGNVPTLDGMRPRFAIRPVFRQISLNLGKLVDYDRLIGSSVEATA